MKDRKNKERKKQKNAIMEQRNKERTKKER